jgi:DNA-binding response OmpR family regulator
MPGVDGFELLRTLRQNPNFNRMTTLVLSALTSEEIESRGGLPEGSIFMAKPINMDWFNGFFTAFLAGRYADATMATRGTTIACHLDQRLSRTKALRSFAKLYRPKLMTAFSGPTAK